jgi:hypothetical protein
VVKGKNVLELKPGAPELATAAIGPSGNLRAPTAKFGKTWVVGFADEAYAQAMGK